MTREELVQVVRRASAMQGERLTLGCAEAFEVAAAHGVELLDVADVCNAHGIKLVRCQLGCFG